MDVEYSLYNLHTGLLKVEFPPPPTRVPHGFRGEDVHVWHFRLPTSQLFSIKEHQKEKRKSQKVDSKKLYN